MPLVKQTLTQLGEAKVFPGFWQITPQKESALPYYCVWKSLFYYASI